LAGLWRKARGCGGTRRALKTKTAAREGPPFTIVATLADQAVGAAFFAGAFLAVCFLAGAFFEAVFLAGAFFFSAATVITDCSPVTRGAMAAEAGATAARANGERGHDQAAQRLFHGSPRGIR
jgi:hypothetical protein